MKQSTWRCFAEARAFVRGLGLRSQAAWREYYKSGQKPADIPTDPYRVYGDTFNGWGDWLGTDVIANMRRVFRPYDEARAFVRDLNLKSRTEWERYCKSGQKPPDIPVRPGPTYGSEFKGWGDWLGTGAVAPQ